MYTFVNMDINDRVQEIIKHYGYTSSEFADAIEVPRSSVSHITSGRNRPSLDFITKIKNRFPEITWDWLIDGMGSMIKEKQDEDKDEDSPILPDLFHPIASEDAPLKIETPENPSLQETNKTKPVTGSSKENDSQRLDDKDNFNNTQNIDNQDKKVTKVVLFYNNGTFEIFEH